MKRLFLSLFVVIMTLSFAFQHNTAKASEISTFNYTVKQGDTINKIALNFELGVDEIINVNPGIDPYNLKIGQIIKIPDLSYIKSLQEEVVRLTNIERAKVGVPPLVSDWQISRVARYKANDMRDNNYFSHYSPTYGDPFVMLRDFGIPFNKAAENIAARQTTPAQVVQAWMNSESHRAAMLNPEYKKIGVGYAEGGYLGYYWVQMFTD